MKYSIITILVLFFIESFAQKDPLLFDPDQILIQAEDKTPEVLLVGSFHFAYYGLDAHVTKEEDQVNVLSEKRQAEMKELVEYIAQFKPNKIAVEGGRNSGYIIRRYEKFLKKPHKNRANEVDQIAFPLMKQFGLDTLYGVNSYGLSRDFYNHPDSAVLVPLMDSIYKDWDFSSTNKMSERYNKLYDKDDELALNNTLLDYFKHMANPFLIN